MAPEGAEVEGRGEGSNDTIKDLGPNSETRALNRPGFHRDSGVWEGHSAGVF